MKIYFFYKNLFFLKKDISFKMLYFDENIDILKQKMNKNTDLEKVMSFIQEAKRGFSLNINITSCLENLFFKLDLVN